ncbi:ankyrin repeat domain-containing protein 24-like [Oscarella lobularis]|uniref:ankyrin repeat domain-containing protein 24-like n=1 Tax=Oscarella lobularis TaxID=121494 RepID=UPI003313A573
MKSLMRRKKKLTTSEWNKYDDKLLQAVELGDLTKIRAAVKKGGIPSKSNADGRTAVYAASILGRSDVLQEVLNADPAAVSVADEQGRQCLHWTVKGGLLGPTEICLKYNADVLAPDSAQMTPLHYAADGGHLEITQHLLEHGASTAIRDRNGCSPLLFAAPRHPDVCKALIESGSSVNGVDSKGKSALMYACESGAQDCVELLLKRGAKKDAEDYEGLTAKEYAHRNGHYALVKLLDEAPAVASWEITESSHVDEENKKEVLAGDVVSHFDSDQVPDDISATLGDQQKHHQEKRSGNVVRGPDSVAADQLKELEEENESLNQELTQLRKDHGSLMERIRILERRSFSPQSRPISPGEVGKPDERLQTFQREIDLLKEQLANGDKEKKALEDQIAVLRVQLESFMPSGSDNDDALDTDEEMNFEEGEFSLPGMDGPTNKGPVPRNLAELSSESPRQVRSQRAVEQQLRGQIATLRLENEKLREGSIKMGSKDEDLERLRFENEDLRERIQELGGDLPTVPMDVYNQLKEAQEDEIASLKRRLANLQNEKEQTDLKQRAMESDMAHRSDYTSKSQDLEKKIGDLTSQLQREEEKHLKVVNSYRSHLLAAAQGHMAIDVQQALFQIVNMRGGGGGGGGPNDVLSGDVV